MEKTTLLIIVALILLVIGGGTYAAVSSPVFLNGYNKFWIKNYTIVHGQNGSFDKIIRVNSTGCIRMNSTGMIIQATCTI